MIRDALLPEFDQETATTRCCLERIPEQQTAWRPHAKSWTLGELGLHLANLLTWTGPTLTQTELDIDPPGGPAWTPPKFESPSATLALFDANQSAARAAIAAASDEDLMASLLV